MEDILVSLMTNCNSLSLQKTLKLYLTLAKPSAAKIETPSCPINFSEKHYQPCEFDCCHVGIAK